MSLKLQRQTSAEILAEYPGYTPRQLFGERFQFDDCTLIETDVAGTTDGALMVVALPGVGAVSTVVGSYLIGELSLPVVAVIETDLIPAQCAIHKWIPTPPIRIHGNGSICVAVSDFQISVQQQSRLIRQVRDALVDFACRHNASSILAVDGHPIEIADIRRLERDAEKLQQQKAKIQIKGPEEKEEAQPPEKDPFERIHFISNSQDIAAKLIEMGHRPVKTGQLLGMTGEILSWSFTANEDAPLVTAMLAPDPVKVPDQRGALQALKTISEIYALGVNLESLQEETTRLRDKVKETISDVASQLRRQLAPKKPSSPPAGMYM